MTYKTYNKVGSPRLHLLNLLREKEIYSEFPKDGFTKVIDESGYYFSQELLDHNFDFTKCTYGKISKDFMTATGYSRPKINTYIEKHGRVVFLTEGYYNLELFYDFLRDEHIKEYIEKRGRPSKR